MKEKFLKYTSCQRKRNDVHPVNWICDCHRNWIHCFVIIDNNKLRFKFYSTILIVFNFFVAMLKKQVENIDNDSMINNGMIPSICAFVFIL